MKNNGAEVLEKIRAILNEYKASIELEDFGVQYERDEKIVLTLPAVADLAGNPIQNSEQIILGYYL